MLIRRVNDYVFNAAIGFETADGAISHEMFQNGPRDLGRPVDGPPHSVCFDNLDRSDGLKCIKEFQNDPTRSLAARGFRKSGEAQRRMSPHNYKENQDDPRVQRSIACPGLS